MENAARMRLAALWKVFPPVDFLSASFDVWEKGETDNAIHVHAQG